jgi:uncharacterized lipoprotein YajG
MHTTKKIFLLSTLLCFVLVLIGCTKKQSEKTVTNPNVVEQEQPVNNKEAEKEEVVVVADIVIDVT